MYTLAKLSRQFGTGRQSRTERVQQRQEEQKLTRQLQAEKEAADQDFSGVTTIAQYRERYNALPSHLKQFFSSPTEVTQQQEVLTAENNTKTQDLINRYEQQIADWRDKRNAGGVSRDRKNRYDDKIDVKREKIQALQEAMSKGATFGEATNFATARAKGLRTELSQLQRIREGGFQTDVSVGRDGQILERKKTSLYTGEVVEFEKFAQQRQFRDIRPKTPVQQVITAERVGVPEASPTPVQTFKSLFKTSDLAPQKFTKAGDLFVPAPGRFPSKPLTPELTTPPNSGGALPPFTLVPTGVPSSLSSQEITSLKGFDLFKGIWRGATSTAPIIATRLEQESEIGVTIDDITKAGGRQVVGPLQEGETRKTEVDILTDQYNLDMTELNKQIVAYNEAGVYDPVKNAKFAEQQQKIFEIKAKIDPLAAAQTEALVLGEARLKALGITKVKTTQDGKETVSFTSPELKADLRSVDLKLADIYEEQATSRIKESVPFIGGTPRDLAIFRVLKTGEEVSEAVSLGAVLGASGLLPTATLKTSNLLVKGLTKIKVPVTTAPLVVQGTLGVVGAGATGFVVVKSTLKGFEEGATLKGGLKARQAHALFAGTKSGFKIAGLVAGSAAGTKAFQERELIRESQKAVVSQSTKTGDISEKGITGKQLTKLSTQRLDRLGHGKITKSDSILESKLQGKLEVSQAELGRGGHRFAIRDVTTGKTRVVDYTFSQGQARQTTYLFQSTKPVPIHGDINKLLSGTRGVLLRSNIISPGQIPRDPTLAFKGLNLKKGVFTASEFASGKPFSAGFQIDKITKFNPTIKVGSAHIVRTDIKSFRTEGTSLGVELKPGSGSSKELARAIKAAKLTGIPTKHFETPRMPKFRPGFMANKRGELIFNQKLINDIKVMTAHSDLKVVNINKDLGFRLQSPVTTISPRFSEIAPLVTQGIGLQSSIIQILNANKKIGLNKNILNKQLGFTQAQLVGPTIIQKMGPEVIEQTLAKQLKQSSIQQPQVLQDPITVPAPVTNPPITTPKIPLIPIGVPFLPGGGSAGKRKKKSKGFYTKSYLPSFTARALGLKPIKVNKAQARKLLNKIQGIGVRRGVVIK